MHRRRLQTAPSASIQILPMLLSGWRVRKTAAIKREVCKWVDAFNAHGAEEIASLYHENAVNHQAANAPVSGIAAIREMFVQEFAAADMTAIAENIFEDGQWAIPEWKDPLGFAQRRVLSCHKRQNPLSAGLLGQSFVFKTAYPAH